MWVLGLLRASCARVVGPMKQWMWRWLEEAWGLFRQMRPLSCAHSRGTKGSIHAPHESRRLCRRLLPGEKRTWGFPRCATASAAQSRDRACARHTITANTWHHIHQYAQNEMVMKGRSMRYAYAIRSIIMSPEEASPATDEAEN